MQATSVHRYARLYVRVSSFPCLIHHITHQHRHSHGQACCRCRCCCKATGQVATDGQFYDPSLFRVHHKLYSIPSHHFTHTSTIHHHTYFMSLTLLIIDYYQFYICTETLYLCTETHKFIFFYG